MDPSQSGIYNGINSSVAKVEAFFRHSMRRSAIGWTRYDRIVQLSEAWIQVTSWITGSGLDAEHLSDAGLVDPNVPPSQLLMDMAMLGGNTEQLAANTLTPNRLIESADSAIQTMSTRLLELWVRVEAAIQQDVSFSTARGGNPEADPEYVAIVRRIGAVAHQVDVDKAAERADVASVRADTAAEKAEQRIAELSAATLAKNQSEYARTQRNIAWALRAVTVILVLGAAWAGYKVNAESDGPLSTVDAIHQFAIVAVILGLAGYVGKQGSQHMAVSIWAQTLSVQLLTFDSFLADVGTEETRDEMRKQFALRAFGSSPETGGDQSDVSWVPQILAAIAERK